MTRNLLFFLYIFFTNTILLAQDLNDVNVLKDIKASPPVPFNEYNNMLLDSLQIPDDNFADFTEDKLFVNLSFYVMKDGSVNKVEIANDDFHLQPYFVEAMNKLPKWNPEVEDGVYINAKKILRVIINNTYKSSYTNYTPAVPYNGQKKYYEDFISNFKLDEQTYQRLKANRVDYITLRIRFEINEEGEVYSVSLVGSVAPDEVSKSAFNATKYLGLWKPAYRNGVAVKSRVTIPMYIRIN